MALRRIAVVHMLLCRAGCATAYLVIIADVLVGAAPEFGGVLPTLLNRHDGVWFLSRAFVVGAVCRGAGLVTVLGRAPSQPTALELLFSVAGSGGHAGCHPSHAAA